MRVENDHWVCSWCGGSIDAALDRPWRTEIHAAGGQRNERLVIIDNLEVHRCTDPGSTKREKARRAFSNLGRFDARPI